MKQGRKAIKLQKYFKEKCGLDVRCWYEPINGPCMEMQGYAGGWYYQELDDEGSPFSTGEPIGYSFDDAITMIDLLSRNMDLI